MNALDVIRIYKEELEAVQTFAQGGGSKIITGRDLGAAKMIAKFGEERVREAMREVFGLYVARGKVPELTAVLKHLNEPYVDKELKNGWVKYDVMELTTDVGRFVFDERYFYLFVEGTNHYWIRITTDEDMLSVKFVGTKDARYRYLNGYRYADYFVRKGCQVKYDVIDEYAFCVFGAEAKILGEPRFERYTGLKYEVAKDCRVLISVYIGYQVDGVFDLSGDVYEVVGEVFNEDVNGNVVGAETYKKFLWLRRALEARQRVLVIGTSDDYINFVHYLRGANFLFANGFNATRIYAGNGVYCYDDRDKLVRGVRTCVRNLLPSVIFYNDEVDVSGILKIRMRD